MNDKKWWQNAHRALTLDVRLYVIYVAGIIASFSALFELAVKYGGWLTPLGILLPAVIDVYWMTALQVALDSSRSKGERAWASIHALLAISLSITGNIMYHELSNGAWHFSEHDKSVLIATLACIPVVLTGTLTHLVLLARAGAAVAPTLPGTGGTGRLVPTGTGLVAPVVPALAPSVPGTTVTAAPTAPVPALPAPGATAGKGRATRPPAGERQPAASRTRRAADPELCERVVREFAAAHPRPGAESIDRRRARAEKFLAEFRTRTGERANNNELGKALGVHPKRDVPEIRAGITEPGERPEGRQEGIA